MKSLVIIFTVLLFSIFGGERPGDVRDRNIHCTDTEVRCSDGDSSEQRTDFNDFALLPLRTASYSGNGGSFAPSLRSTSSGRRVQPSTKSAFRLIKAGKTLDINNLYTFRKVLLQFQTGIRSNRRYIHSICQLLI